MSSLINFLLLLLLEVQASLAQAVPTIHLCGDSTMAEGGSTGTSGWGPFLHYSFSPDVATINNQAQGGRSARSFTREGRFDTVIESIQSGDWAIIEFGHNDGGSLSKDNGRTDCSGEGDETCEVTYNGVAETVLTFPAYLKNAAAKMLEKGAKVVMSTSTPRNVWQSGEYSWGPSRFYYYSWLVASELGGPAEGIYFVPHGAYGAQAMKNLGNDTVHENFPIDHLHTSPWLADVMHQAFVLGLKCGTTELGEMALNSTESLTSTDLGPCIEDFNSTITDLLR